MRANVVTIAATESIGFIQVTPTSHGLVIGTADSDQQVSIIGTSTDLVAFVERIAAFVQPMLDPIQYTCYIEAHQD